MANLELNIAVNTETGQLEVLGSKLDKAGRAADSASGGFGKLSGAAGSLAKSLLPFASAGAIVAFFTNAVKGAEEENEALRRLRFTVEANGQSWSDAAVRVSQWSQEIQKSTRFSDTAALQSIDRLARSTSNIGQAQAAATLAMNLSVVSGKNLSETTELVNGLLQKQSRSVMLAHREFGTYAGAGQTAQEVLDSLVRTTADAALKEESLTKSTSQARNAFGEFSDQIGQTFIPAVNFVMQMLTKVIKVIDSIGDVTASMAAQVFHAFEGIGRAISAVLRGDFGAVQEIVRTTLAKIQSDAGEAALNIEQTWELHEQTKTKVAESGSQDRLNVTNRELEEEARKREELAFKIVQLEAELEQKLQGLGAQTYQKKVAALESEIAVRRAKIIKEVTLEQEKTKLLAKLDQYEAASKKQLAQSEVLTKYEAALQVGNLAVQTLQTVNALGDKGSEAERTRAKALLALQQAIAIGWAWVHAVRIGGPFAPAIAAAETALIVAQFAQGLKNIDNAARQEQAGISGIKLDAPVPGIDLGSSPQIGDGGGRGGSVGAGTFTGSGGGGSGVAGAIINVGGIVVNFSADQLSVDNVDAVMLKMYEKLRQGTVEGIQLALQMKTLGERNGSLAS